ncbi:DUF2726 domain-containing protein [Streptomyces lydicus]|uniref:DUF2726 domain-containing protein n=1 Tax=Streptomyces lydicus TaxID=47763 RepID=UPI0028704158|nr:DUF2726 domain-containing protein [Streptomyces lydicus]
MNRYEAAADRILQQIAAEYGDRLLLKVGLVDAIDIDGMNGLTSRAKSYALRAHLDFLMVDTATGCGRFAVELDGRQHASDSQTRERDRLKDDICARADLPLLRIASDFARQVGRWSVLSYLTEAFYRSEAFHKAQEGREIPFDEVFDIANFVTLDGEGHLALDTLDGNARLSLLQHGLAARIPATHPDLFCTKLPQEGSLQAHAWMAIAPDRYLISKVVVRDFRFSGIAAFEFVEQLARVEIAELVDRWLAGEEQGVAQNGTGLNKAVAEVQAAIDTAGGTVSIGYGAALSGGGNTISLRFPAGTLRLPHHSGFVNRGTYED